MSYWVAMTKPNSEHIAYKNLERQGYIAYLPRFLSRQGKKLIVKTLFPRYIFIRAELQWHSVTGTRGITRLIYGTNQQPAIIPDQVIDIMKAREDKKGYVSLPDPPKFIEGQRVAIAKNGLFGLYSGQLPHDRHKVLVELMGRMVPVEVDEADLTAVAIGDSK